MSNVNNFELVLRRRYSHPCCHSGKSSAERHTYSDVRSTNDLQPVQRHRTLHTDVCNGHPSFVRRML